MAPREGDSGQRIEPHQLVSGVQASALWDARLPRMVFDRAGNLVLCFLLSATFRQEPRDHGALSGDSLHGRTRRVCAAPGPGPSSGVDHGRIGPHG